MSIDCKIVLLGESNVGKTCFIMRYKNNNFIDDHLITVGASHEVKDITIKGKDIKVKIWDTCGNEQFRSITKIFYKGADIVLLVYDITNQNSFDELKNYWYKEVQENTENVKVIAVIGNKSDLIEKEVVSDEEAIKFTEEIKAEFGKTSALTGDGIDDIMNDVISKFLDIVSKYNDDGNQLYDYIKDLNQLVGNKNRKNDCKC